MSNSPRDYWRYGCFVTPSGCDYRNRLLYSSELRGDLSVFLSDFQEICSTFKFIVSKLLSCSNFFSKSWQFHKESVMMLHVG